MKLHKFFLVVGCVAACERPAETPVSSASSNASASPSIPVAATTQAVDVPVASKPATGQAPVMQSQHS